MLHHIQAVKRRIRRRLGLDKPWRPNTAVCMERIARSEHTSHFQLGSPHAGNLLEDEFYRRVAAMQSPRILEIGSRRIVAPVDKTRFPAGASYVGLDIMAGSNVDVVGDAHRLSQLVEPGSFDAVVSLATFEHIAMPWKLALEVNRILKPGGIAYLATHHVYPIHELPWDFWRFGYDALPAAFSPDVGFECLNRSVRWSCQIVDAGSLALLEPARKHYLFAEAMLRKTRDYDADAYCWDLDCSDLFPSSHFYPKNTTQLAEEKANNDGDCQYVPPTVLCQRQLFAEHAQALAAQGPGRGLLVLGPGADRALASVLAAGWEWGTVILSADRDLRRLREDVRRAQDGRGFDAVVAIDVLSHVAEPWTVGPLLSGCLEPGGTLLARELTSRGFVPGEGDYWRFTNEALKIVYNRTLGLEPVRTGFSDPVLVVSDEAEPPPYEWTSFLYACGLFRRGEAVGAEGGGRCVWGAG